MKRMEINGKEVEIQTDEENAKYVVKRILII